MTLNEVLKNRFVHMSFDLVLARRVALVLLVLSICLPNLHITYEDFTNHYQLETFSWYTSLLHRQESGIAVQDSSAIWSVYWFAIPVFAFPFVLMYFGLKKKYTFDVGITLFALFLGTMVLPPLITPLNATAGWDSIKPELLVGSYLAAFVLVAYSIARPLLSWKASRLEADRIPPVVNVAQSELAIRRLVLVLALLSFFLPFAMEYSYHRFSSDLALSDILYFWFGNVGFYPFPFSILFLPLVYLPLIMMWLGLKRSGLFSKGTALFVVYWVWHLLFFSQIRSEVTPNFVHFSAPAVGVAFFPAVLVVYAFMFLHLSQRINQLLQKLDVTGGKPESKAFFKKCTNCGKDIPIASEECPQCRAKQS